MYFPVWDWPSFLMSLFLPQSTVKQGYKGQVLTLTGFPSETIVHTDLIVCHFSGLALVCLVVWWQLCCYYIYISDFIYFRCLSLIALRQGYTFMAI